jgi:hypothetical protein
VLIGKVINRPLSEYPLQPTTGRLLVHAGEALCESSQRELVMGADHSRLPVLLTAAVAICGCSPEPPKARYTVDEYLANPQAMEAKLHECANNPGDSGRDPECVNVRAAAERQGIGSLRDLPPMGLNPPAEKDRPNGTVGNPEQKN